MKAKKIPLRKCIVCGEGKPKKELIRVVRNTEKIATVDVSGKINGRGAYICANIKCIEMAQKNNKLARALEVEVFNDIYEELRNIVELEL